METGVQIFYHNYQRQRSDAELVRLEMDLALRAERLGFDYLLAPEHHFVDYCVSPDPCQSLAFIAGQTSRIKLMTAAMILPWNDPVRVLEQASHLDHLCDGRLIMGLGRGLARKEYEAFGLDMGESRERFEESARIIVNALKTGKLEADGPHFRQMPVEIRPEPRSDLLGRLGAVVMSPDSAPLAAEIGARMTSFVAKPIEAILPVIENYRALFREHHPDREVPAPMMIDFTYCHEDAEEAERVAREYLAKYYFALDEHYEFSGSHFSATKGYQQYADDAVDLQKAGRHAAAEIFIESQIWGTPEQIVEKQRHRMEQLGDCAALFGISYAGMPYDKVRASFELLGTQVVPELKKIAPKGRS